MKNENEKEKEEFWKQVTWTHRMNLYNYYHSSII